MPDKLLTVKQAADLLGITQGAIYEAVRKGKLAYVRIAGIRFTEAELDAWVQRETRVPVNLPATPTRRSDPEPELRGTGRYH